jgi:hypothetical protein
MGQIPLFQLLLHRLAEVVAVALLMDLLEDLVAAV